MPAHHYLALVNLKGGAGVVVRDITDLSRPMTLCTISGGGSGFRFVDATHVSYISSPGGGGSAGALYEIDLTTQRTSLVRAWTDGWYGSWIYAWSPSGQMLSYLKSDSTGLEWHLLAGGADRTLSRLGTVPARDVNGDIDDLMVGFSYDGQYVALEETFTYQYRGQNLSPAPPFQVVRVADGALVYSRTDATMAAWAGNSDLLYFRTTSGVQAWDPTNQARTVLQGVGWIHPWPSADVTGRVVFSTLDQQGNHHVQLLENSGGTSYRQVVVPPRTAAAFITPTLLWYEEEQVCTTDQPCGMGGPPLTGKTFVDDLTTSTESQSVISGVYDSWPHFAGQA